MLIKVGFLVSYDYEYLRISLPLVYKEADFIGLAIDQQRRTWNGGTFSIDDSFFDWLHAIDVDRKISIYEDDFYDPALTAIENDSRERNMLAQFMEKGGWHVQVDADEYFLNFATFASWLRAHPQWLDDPASNPVDICAFLVVLYKKIPGGFLYVNENYDLCVLATNFPRYNIARTGINKRIFLPQVLLHQSWARNEDEISFKFANWGHTIDFNTSSHFRLWKNASEENYKTYHDFHPLKGSGWQSLGAVKGEDMNSIIHNLNKTGVLQFPSRLLIKWRLKEIKRQFMIRFFGRKY
ncbi:MAG TPA: hypothetical protein VM012_01700 [Flavitalea sp.]|nr:hypothetical protein [Flavitalea sp.]